VKFLKKNGILKAVADKKDPKKPDPKKTDSKGAASGTSGEEEKKPPHPLVVKTLALLKAAGTAIVKKAADIRKAVQEPDSVWVQFPFIFKGLSSPDGPTRRMSLVFFVSVLSILVLVSFKVGRTLHERAIHRKAQAKLEAERIAEDTRIERDLEQKKVGLISLGKFVIQLKGEVPFKPVGGPHPLNLAEIDILIYCDSLETQTYIHAHLTQVRNEVTSVFVAVDRKEILSPKGKAHLAQQILEKINEWLPEGSVENVFFGRFVIG
jgi:hypothetical protein